MDTVQKNPLLRRGIENRAVRKLNLWLKFLRFLPADFDADTEVFTEATHSALRDFQAVYGLNADGIFGGRTFSEMRDVVYKAQADAVQKVWGTLHCTRVDLETARTTQLLRCPAYFVTGGLMDFTFRIDAAFWYLQLWQKARGLGIAIPSVGALRNLKAPVTAARSATSMHYPAIAFDLHTGTGMNNPEKDLFVMELTQEGYWQVWARVIENNTEGEIRTIQNPYTYTQRAGTRKPVTGRFVDFTALCAEFHFIPIRPRRSFFDMSQTAGRVMMGAEWWHFQNDFVLMEGWSSFFGELRRLYSTEFLDTASSTVRAGYPKIYANEWF